MTRISIKDPYYFAKVFPFLEISWAKIHVKNLIMISLTLILMKHFSNKYGPWPVMQKERVEMGIYIKYTIANQMNGHLSHRKSNDKEKLSCSSIFANISKHTLGSYVLKSHSAS